jgi:hypothetical protein
MVSSGNGFQPLAIFRSESDLKELCPSHTLSTWKSPFRDATSHEKLSLSRSCAPSHTVLQFTGVTLLTSLDSVPVSQVPQ